MIDSNRENIRPELKRLLKKYYTLERLTGFLGCSKANAKAMCCRGYLSSEYALRAAGGGYRASLLVKK